MLIYFSSLTKELPQLKLTLKQLQVRSRVLQAVASLSNKIDEVVYMKCSG